MRLPGLDGLVVETAEQDGPITVVIRFVGGVQLVVRAEDDGDSEIDVEIIPPTPASRAKP